MINFNLKQTDLNLNIPSKYNTDLDKEDLEMIHGKNLCTENDINWDIDFGSLSTQQLMDKIKHLQNLAYQLGVEEGLTIWI